MNDVDPAGDALVVVRVKVAVPELLLDEIDLGFGEKEAVTPAGKEPVIDRLALILPLPLPLFMVMV